VTAAFCSRLACTAPASCRKEHLRRSATKHLQDQHIAARPDHRPNPSTSVNTHARADSRLRRNRLHGRSARRLGIERRADCPLHRRRINYRDPELLRAWVRRHCAASRCPSVKSSAHRSSSTACSTVRSARPMRIKRSQPLCTSPLVSNAVRRRQPHLARASSQSRRSEHNRAFCILRPQAHSSSGTLPRSSAPTEGQFCAHSFADNRPANPCH
jgi:hypothetical protein